jgi:hypothetical protein
LHKVARGADGPAFDDIPRAPVIESRYTRCEVAKKKKVKRFRVVTAVKEMARERIGTPPPTQVVPDRKKRKKEKYKPTLEKLLGDR